MQRLRRNDLEALDNRQLDIMIIQFMHRDREQQDMQCAFPIYLLQ